MAARITCDAWGCDESYPLDHDALGEPDFPPGRWPGWLYLTVQYAALNWRELRFCDARCMQWWLDMASERRYRPGHLDKLIDAARERGDLGPAHLRKGLADQER